MSNTTTNLKLFKYDTTTDGKEVFSINTALNDNWDKIDVLGGTVSGLSTNVSTLSSTVSTHTTDITSLKDSVKSILTATVSKAANGYIKFSNGVIVQWGSFSSVYNTATAITLPTAFSGTSYRVVLNQYGTAVTDSYVNSITVTALAASKFTYKSFANEKPTYHWHAIGY